MDDYNIVSFRKSGHPEQVKPSSPPASFVAPQLLEPIRDHQVNEGEPVQFRCNIVGTPEPLVQWFYNNQPIKPSKYFQLSSENGYHILNIAGVFPEDEGTYKCTARNPIGEVTCIAQLRVIRELFCYILCWANEFFDQCNDVIESGDNVIESGDDVIESGDDVIESGDDVIESGDDVIDNDDDVIQSQ